MYGSVYLARVDFCIPSIPHCLQTVVIDPVGYDPEECVPMQCQDDPLGAYVFLWGFACVLELVVTMV